MKRICFIILTVFLGLNPTLAQEYSFPLYFEDSAGNKDTLWFGFDENATFDVDEELGEVNLINEPLDSVFNVFFTDAVTINADELNDNYLELTLTPNFILKTQYNAIDNYPINWIEFGCICKNWPLKISWDQEPLMDFLDDAQYEAYKKGFFMSSWHPPVSIMGDIHSCGYWPNDFTNFKESSFILLEYNNFCHYSSVLTPDSTCLFYIGFSGLLDDIPTIAIPESTVWYNTKEKLLIFSQIGREIPSLIDIYNSLGRKIESRMIDTIINPTLSLNFLKRGVYIIKITTNNGDRQNSKLFKITVL